MGRSVRGVTLVELLVVLAVIALIAAFLFPLLSATRERGRQGACLAQLRQLGQAFTMYRQDYGEYPPWNSFGQRLKPYVKDDRLWVCPSFKAPPGIQVAASYMNRLDRDHLWDTGQALGPRSVIVYCDSHVEIKGYDRQRGGDPITAGVYTVLRHDGSAERIPAAKVRSIEKPIRSSSPGGPAADVVLQFPE
jgi:prepilin-type N-terminal cleavage/methylation domain-containing protein